MCGLFCFSAMQQHACRLVCTQFSLHADPVFLDFANAMPCHASHPLCAWRLRWASVRRACVCMCDVRVTPRFGFRTWSRRWWRLFIPRGRHMGTNESCFLWMRVANVYWVVGGSGSGSERLAGGWWEHTVRYLVGGGTAHRIVLARDTTAARHADAVRTKGEEEMGMSVGYRYQRGSPSRLHKHPFLALSLRLASQCCRRLISSPLFLTLLSLSSHLHTLK